MSADAWSNCPRCIRRTQEVFASRQKELDASYGTVPVEKFLEAREALAKDLQEAARALEGDDRTFREDYEIYGAEDGVITVSYSGECRKCGLKLTFTHEQPIPGVED